MAILLWWLLLWAACSASLVVMLFLYEERLKDPRPFNRIEKKLYRFGIWCDRKYNQVFLSVLFLEFPFSHRETASLRFQRHRHKAGCRGALARLCWKIFIQRFAPNHHETIQKTFPHEE